MEEREILFLIYNYLSDHNLFDTAEKLQKEAKYDVSMPPKDVKVEPLQKILDGFHERRLKKQFDEVNLATGVGSTKERKKDDEELLNNEVDFPYPKNLKNTIVDIHTQNPLSIRFNADKYMPLVASGGADRMVMLTDVQNGALIGSYDHHKAGVLALDFHPIHSSYLLTGSMDATHALIDTSRDENEAILATWKEHQKFVVRILWAPNGEYFATSSYDKTSCLSKFDETNPQNSSLLKKFNFKGAVEAIAFTNDSKYFVVTARDDNYLYYVSLPELEITKYNMNSFGDDFISFTVMELKFHPNGKYLLAATDKSRLILFRTRTNEQVLNIYGVATDALTQPRLVWHPNGRYFFVSQENSICVVDITTQTVVHRLIGHVGIVRDLHFHPINNWLVSASYDRTFKIWEE
jgi:COMPASS component SWD3